MVGMEFSEASIRLAIFIGLFATLAALEIALPRRIPREGKSRRWLTNWAIVLIDSVVLRLVFAGAAVGVAFWVENKEIGVFHWIGAPQWIAILISFVVLDFAIWFAHVASHKIPVLWRIHRMHHSDVDFDVSTAIRFHPIEIVASMAFKSVIVIALGAPPVAVLIFEVVLNGAAMFNHSNLKLAPWLDRALRWLIVTPDMHRVHHSIIHTETDSNYGFNLAIWDRLFGTYIDQPEKGHGGMVIGLAEWQDEQPTRLGWALKVPFIKQR